MGNQYGNLMVTILTVFVFAIRGPFLHKYLLYMAFYLLTILLFVLNMMYALHKTDEYVKKNIIPYSCEYNFDMAYKNGWNQTIRNDTLYLNLHWFLASMRLYYDHRGFVSYGYMNRNFPLREICVNSK